MVSEFGGIPDEELKELAPGLRGRFLTLTFGHFWNLFWFFLMAFLSGGV